MSRLNVNSVNPHDGIKVSITGSTNGGVVISGSGDNVTNPLLAVEGTISASGNLTASNAFFSGDIHGVGNIYVQGHATLSAYTAGGIQLGDTNTDNVTFGADINSSIIPNINNTYDLGSDAQEWRDIYVERIGYIDTITQDDASTTNTFKGDSQFMDDAGAISLFVHSADGNIGVKVADPNQELEVAGRISSSLQLSVGNSGNEIGHITGSGNLVISGTAVFLSGIETTHVTASGQISSSGTSGNYFGGTIYLDTTEAIATKGTTNSKIQMNTGQVRLFGNHASHADITIGNGSGNGGVVINESGQDQDFRIEGNTDANLLFVDAGADKIAIGTATVGNSLLTVDGDLTATHITASGNISASGTIYADNFESTGGDSAGISFTDDMIVTGNITASGNISSSGDGSFTGTLTADGNVDFNGDLDVDGITNLDVVDIDDEVDMNKSLSVRLNITASGNISSSGNIYSQTSRTIGNVEVGGEAQFGSTGFQVDPPSTVYVTGDITATTNITASGNISSSGDVYAESIILPFGQAVNWGAHDGNHISVDSGTGNIIFDTLPVQIGNGLNVTGTLGHITASGNISSSGTVFGETLRVGAGNSIIDGNVKFNGGIVRPLKSITADTVLDATAGVFADAGKTIVLNKADGAVVTLPAAVGSGNVYNFFVATAITSNSYIIKVADSTDTFIGAVHMMDADDDSQTSITAKGTDDTLTMNGGTTGGVLLGDTLTFTDIATNKYVVQGNLIVPAGSNPADPFSATV